MTRILICDDQSAFVFEVSARLREFEKKYGLTFDTTLKTDPQSVLREDAFYDIAFIDVEMPGIDGIELSKRLYEINNGILVIIITSYEKYLDDAMRIRVFRYLSKPLSSERFERALKEALEEHKNQTRSFKAKCGNTAVLINTSDVLFFENIKHGCIIHTKHGDLKSSEKPAELLTKTNASESFTVSHLGITVNLSNVVGLSKNGVVLKKSDSETVLTYVSQRRFKDFKKAFLDYTGGLL